MPQPLSPAELERDEMLAELKALRTEVRSIHVLGFVLCVLAPVVLLAVLSWVGP